MVNIDILGFNMVMSAGQTKFLKHNMEELMNLSATCHVAETTWHTVVQPGDFLFMISMILNQRVRLKNKEHRLIVVRMQMAL